MEDEELIPRVLVDATEMMPLEAQSVVKRGQARVTAHASAELLDNAVRCMVLRGFPVTRLSTCTQESGVTGLYLDEDILLFEASIEGEYGTPFLRVHGRWKADPEELE